MIDLSWIKTKEELEKWLKQEAEDLLRKELAKKEQETQELAYKDKGVVYSGPDFTQKGTEEEIEKRKDFGSLFGLNRAQAEAHAKEKGWLTLETTEIGRAIENSGLDEKFGKDTIWNAFSSLSKVYAEELSGDVKAFVQGANHESKSNVFFQTELPALLENKKVTSINGVEKEEIKKAIKDDPSLKEAHKILDEGFDQNVRPQLQTTIYEVEVTQKNGQPFNVYEEQKAPKEVPDQKQSAEQADPPKPKTKEELEREEQVAKKIVDTVVNEAKTAVIGAIGGSALATAYEAKTAYDEAEKPNATATEQPKQEHQDQEVEQRYKVKVEHEGTNYTVKIEAKNSQEAQQQALSLFEDKDFVDNLKGLKAGQTLNARVDFEEAMPKSPFQAEEEKKKEEQKVEIKIEEPKLSL